MEDKVSNLLNRCVTNVIVRKELEEKLRKGQKLKIYLGIDPTSTKIHLGNAVPLRKLRDFQNEGHEVIFLVGTFTAMIGDTSDKDAMRTSLTAEQIDANFKTYKEQASKILDFSRAKIVYNNDWLGKLSFADVVKLGMEFTVQQMIERDMYQKRLKAGKPIGLHEFFYPLMQGYDSVELDVDLEIGGNDQMFNMLAGRTLQRKLKGKDKHVLTTALIDGTDGRKMSKSYKNVINIDDAPNDQFGRLMSMTDDSILPYFEFCTDLSLEEINVFKEEMKQGKNPRDYKMRLAREIVDLYHPKGSGKKAEEAFIQIFQKKDIPDDIEIKTITKQEIGVLDLLFETGLVTSKGEARRVIQGGGVKINGEKILNISDQVSIKEEKKLIQVGKRRFIYVKI